jgi:hypothetical protein
MTNHNVTDPKTKTETTTVHLPLPPAMEAHGEMEIYARFMRHLRMLPQSCTEIKVLSAIQFTADMLDLNDAIVSKTLVDLGLRAPRRAFPAEYLRHVDESLMRSGWEVGAPTKASQDIRAHWDAIGEDKFAPFRTNFDIAEPAGIFVRV